MGKITEELQELSTKMEEIKKEWQKVRYTDDNKASELDAEFKRLSENVSKLLALAKIEQVIDQIKDVLPFIEEEILPFVHKLIPEAARHCTTLAVDVMQEVDSDLIKLQKLSAVRYREFYKALTDNDFTKTEALQILIATIKPISVNDVAIASKNIPR